MTAAALELEQLAAMSARALVRDLRAGGPLREAVADELATRGAGGRWGSRNRERARAYFRAEYYAWTARRRFAAHGVDVATGADWPKFGAAGELGRRIARAENTAAARVAYEHARAFRSPFELLTQAEGWARA